MDVLDDLEKVYTIKEKPVAEVKIVDCGVTS